MKYLVSNRLYPIDAAYTQVSLQHFHDWITRQDSYQLDIETNVVEKITEREIHVVQFGSCSENLQYVLDVASFTPPAIDYVKGILSNAAQEKLIHNALFEYSVIKYCWGVDIDNIFDTFLLLKVVLNGKNTVDKIFTLAGALGYFLGVTLDKELQTSFDGQMLTTPQILYAAKDVEHLAQLKQYLQLLPDYHFHDKVIRMENKVVRVFGDIVVNGFGFDTQKWRENMAWVTPKIEEAREKVFEYMRTHLYNECVELGFIQSEDAVTVKWTSTKEKSDVLMRIYPELASVKKPALAKFEITLPDENFIFPLLNKDYDTVNQVMLYEYRDLMKEMGFLKEKNEILINLNSPLQRLKLFQLVDPTLTSTAAEELENSKNEMIKQYLDFISKDKLLSSYGEKWFNYVCEDGKIRCQFVDQVLDTGRVSVKRPAMMTLPADEGRTPDDIGDRYRSPFIPSTGFKIVAGDYRSQELCIIAFLAQEEVWLNALKNGWDLHSMCASLVFKDKWVKAGGDITGKKKPSDSAPEAVKMRSFTKTISFGLAYGGGPGMMSKRLNISMGEARQLINDYFSTFPKLRDYFEKRAKFGTDHGYIDTAAPFHRRRYFAQWGKDSIDPADYASIQRMSKNTSIQGTGADGAKVAMILIKDYIEKNNLGDTVRVLFMLHDAIVTEAREEFAETWKLKMEELMNKGHSFNVPGNLIGTDIKITDHWTK